MKKVLMVLLILTSMGWLHATEHNLMLADESNFNLINDHDLLETSVKLDTSGHLSIIDSNGGNSIDKLTLTIEGANLRVTDLGQNFSVSGTGVYLVNSHTVDVPLSNFTGDLIIDTKSGTDVLNFDADLVLTGDQKIEVHGITTFNHNAQVSFENGGIDYHVTKDFNFNEGSRLNGIGNGDVVIKSAGNITIDGRIQNSGSSNKGRIFVSGGDQGEVRISGIIDASGKNNGASGGQVIVLGEKVGLFGEAKIDVSGILGGGELLLGGEQQGAVAVAGEANTDVLYIDDEAEINADAISEGKGGRIITWANHTNRAYGDISARGGLMSGRGGFVEISGGQYFEIGDTPDVSANNGLGGHWLIDPTGNDLNIVAGGGNTNINSSNPFATTNDAASLGWNLIRSALIAGTSVTVTTTNSGFNSQNGDINVNTDLDYNGIGTGKSLTLNAIGNIFFNNKIFDSTGADDILSLNLIAGGAIDYDADGSFVSGAFSATATNGSITITGDFNIGTEDVLLNSGDQINVANALTTGVGAFIVTDGLLNLQGNLATNGNLTLSAAGADIAGNALLNSGTLNTTGDITISGNWTATAGVSINMLTNARLILDGNVSQAVTQNGVQLGNVTVNNTGAATPVITWVDAITLQGNLTLQDGAVSLTAGGSLTDDLLVTQPLTLGGTLEVGGDVTFSGSGTFSTSGSSTLRFNGTFAQSLTSNGQTFDTLEVEKSNALSINDTATVSGLILTAGSLNTLSQSLTAIGPTSFNGGGLILAGNTVDLNGPVTSTGGSIEHTGGTLAFGHGTVNLAAIDYNGGVFSTTRFDGAAQTLATSADVGFGNLVISSSSMLVQGGSGLNVLNTLTTNGTLVLGGGTANANTLIINAGGLLNTNLLNIDVADNATINGSLIHDVGGLGSVDPIGIGGALSLNSSHLEATLGFIPTAGEPIKVITHNGSTGSFATQNLPIAFTWDIEYNANDIALVVTGCTGVDAENPTIEPIANQSMYLRPNNSFIVPDYTGLAQVTDNCDTNPVITQTPIAGTVISPATPTNVTLTVEDAENNVNQESFTVTAANTIPVTQNLTGQTTLTCPQDSTLTLQGSENGFDYYLRNETTHLIVDGPAIGTGSALDFQTGVISETTAFHVFAANPSFVLDFDGIDDYVFIPHDESLIFSDGITIEAWVNPTDITTNTWYDIYRKENDADAMGAEGRMLLMFQDNGTHLTLGIQTTGSGYIELDVDINPLDYEGQWSHILAFYDDATNIMRMYVNGNEVGSLGADGTIVNPSPSKASDAIIGAFEHPTLGIVEHFEGKIASLRIRDKALTTQAEINHAKDNLFTGDETNLVAYYPFYENAGTQLNDVSIYANNGTINGATWASGTTGGVGAVVSNTLNLVCTVYVDLNANGADDGSSWADAFDTVQEGVDASGAGSEVLVAEGTYMITDEITINQPLNIRGGFPTGGGMQNIDAHSTTLDASAVTLGGTPRVIKANHASGSLFLEGLVIQRGDLGIGLHGGGIHTSGDLLLDQMTVISNAADQGGGIYSLNGHINVTNSTISNNDALSSGGGIHVQSADVTLIDTLINENEVNPPMPNVPTQGGGLWSNQGLVTMINTRVSNNTTFSNSATVQGGGIYSVGSVNLINSQLSFNVASSITGSGQGGGLYHEKHFSSDSLKLINSLLFENMLESPNSQPAEGGGLYSDSILFLTNSAVVANLISGQLAQSDGAGIYGNAVFLENSVLWGNLITGMSSEIEFDDFLSTSHSLIKGLDLSVDNGLDASDPGFDPMFTDEMNGIFSLQLGSPLIDAGDFNLLPLDDFDVDGDDDLLERIPLDLAGMTRELGTNVEIGPYEFQPEYLIGGQLSGLLVGNEITLQNSADALTLSDNGAFAFSVPVAVGDGYGVIVLDQPNNPIQPCMVTNGSGTISNQDITDVVVSCEVGDDLIFRDGFE